MLRFAQQNKFHALIWTCQSGSDQDFSILYIASVQAMYGAAKFVLEAFDKQTNEVTGKLILEWYQAEALLESAKLMVNNETVDSPHSVEINDDKVKSRNIRLEASVRFIYSPDWKWLLLVIPTNAAEVEVTCYYRQKFDSRGKPEITAVTMYRDAFKFILEQYDQIMENGKFLEEKLLRASEPQKFLIILNQIVCKDHNVNVGVTSSEVNRLSQNLVPSRLTVALITNGARNGSYKRPLLLHVMWLALNLATIERTLPSDSARYYGLQKQRLLERLQHA